jgi:hypothetical protein
MGILVREAELPRDRAVLLAVLLRNRDADRNGLRQARFEWSYFRNPYGAPRAWLAINQSSGKVIGMAGAFPREILVSGKSVRCWNTGDFSIDREFRTLGVALKLRYAEKSCVDRGEAAFLYCCPVDRMRIVLERDGHIPLCKIPRHRVVLRVDRFFDQWMGAHLWSSGLARLANPLMHAWWGNFSHSRGLTVQLQPNTEFGAEYDELFDRVKHKHPVITVRDSRFLSWRFLQNPLYHDIKILRLSGNEGRLKGYAVVEAAANGAGRVLDFLVDDESGVRPLLGGIIRYCRERRICTLGLRATDANRIVRDLRSFGLIFRDAQDSAVMAYTAPDSSYRSALEDGSWFMTEADRDV